MRIRQPHYTLFIIYIATGYVLFNHSSQGMKTPPAQRLDIQCFAKGRLLQSKRRPFSVRFAAFCNAKGRLLENHLDHPGVKTASYLFAFNARLRCGKREKYH